MVRIAFGERLSSMHAPVLSTVTLLTALYSAVGTGGDLQFSEVLNSGIVHQHTGTGPGIHHERYFIGGGVAVGDVDGNGYADVFLVGGYNPDPLFPHPTPNQLFLNQGGSFVSASLPAFMRPDDCTHSGPLFADFNHDGWLDLLIPGFEDNCTVLATGSANGWTNDTVGSQLPTTGATIGVAAADYSDDGRLDLFLGRWSSDGFISQLFDGTLDGSFVDRTVGAFDDINLRFTFTPNFEDFDGDGQLDLLIAADFGYSKVLRNQGGIFTDMTDPLVITDENGMGAAVADYDNDGDYDWFVTSIFDEDGVAEANWGISGNRLYRNDNGVFVDATDVAGVREGDWGWGACFADFNNDGHLDIFHTNGFHLGNPNPPPPDSCLIDPSFCHDPSRLFLSDGDGTFTESAAAVGLIDTEQGRGVACFDFDHDGDQDILVANNAGPTRVYANQLTGSQWLTVIATDPVINVAGIGTEVRVASPGGDQLRRIRAGSNFASQNAAEAHFGLASDSLVDELTVTWPDGFEQTLSNVPANQRLLVTKDRILISSFD